MNSGGNFAYGNLLEILTKCSVTGDVMLKENATLISAAVEKLA